MGGGLWPVFLGALPSLVGVLSKLYLEGSDARITRRIEKDTALLEAVPKDCKPDLHALICDEVQTHIKRRQRRVDWSAIVALVFVATVTGGVCWLLAYLALNFSGWFWFAFVPAAVFGVALFTTGLFRIFIYPGDEGYDRPSRQQSKP